MSRKAITVGMTGFLVAGLVGCTGDATPEPPQTGAVPQLLASEMAIMFDTIGFQPDVFSDSVTLLDSVSPGLTTSDASCFKSFGVGLETDPTLSESVVEFATDRDSTMTAVVVSTGDVAGASKLMASTVETTDRCADGSGFFELQGTPVETTVDQRDITLVGVDEASLWFVEGTVGGTDFKLMGATARVGGDVLTLVGWNPVTHDAFLARATQSFVTALYED
jgi:hypothetical protein